MGCSRQQHVYVKILPFQAYRSSHAVFRINGIPNGHLIICIDFAVIIQVFVFDQLNVRSDINKVRSVVSHP